MSAKVYPLFFEPVIMEKVWGGRNLSKLGKTLPADIPIGESWEVSDHHEHQSRVKNGPLTGRTLKEVLEQWGVRLVGEVPAQRFPCPFQLLIKYIDAQQVLSVQVHPDDRLAQRYKERDPGKTEIWYILEAVPCAELICGLKEGVTPELVRSKLNSDELPELFERVPVKRGDAIFLAAGTVHALTEGIVVAEIQRTSDLTYRMYDWGRVGFDGKPRPLHLDKAMEAINFEDNPGAGLVTQATRHTEEAEISEIIRCEFFTVEHIVPLRRVTFECTGASFNILMVIEGSGRLTTPDASYDIDLGDSVLLPAELGRYELEGKLELLRVWIG